MWCVGRGVSYRCVNNADQELQDHVATGGLKKGTTKHLFSDKPPWRHGYCLRAPSDLPVRLPAQPRPTRCGVSTAIGKGNNADPDFTNEEVLTVYVFGLINRCDAPSHSQPLIRISNTITKAALALCGR